MTHVHPVYGPNRIGVQERSESFYLNCGYGYGMAEEVISALKVGCSVIYDGEEWKYLALYENDALLKQDSGIETKIDPLTRVEVPEEYVFYGDDQPKGHALGEYWNWHEGDGLRGLSPEIELEDVPYLLRALADLPTCPKSVKDVILDAVEV